MLREVSSAELSEEERKRKLDAFIISLRFRIRRCKDPETCEKLKDIRQQLLNIRRKMVREENQSKRRLVVSDEDIECHVSASAFQRRMLEVQVTNKSCKSPLVLLKKAFPHFHDGSSQEPAQSQRQPEGDVLFPGQGPGISLF